MTTQHMKECWRSGETEPALAQFSEQDLVTIIELEGYGPIAWVDATPIDDPEVRRRTDLVSAAPELLEALEAMVTRYGPHGNALAAIRKTRGES